MRFLTFTRHTLVWWVLSLLFFCLSGYVGDGSTDRREILHGGTYRSRTGLLRLGAVPPGGYFKSEMLGLNFGHFDREYIENGKSQRYMSIRA